MTTVYFMGGPQDGLVQELPGTPPYYFFSVLTDLPFMNPLLSSLPESAVVSIPPMRHVYRHEERLGMWEDSDGVPSAFETRHCYFFVGTE